MRTGQALCPHCSYVLVPGDVHSPSGCSVLLESGQVVSVACGCWFQGLLMECPLCHVGAVARTEQGRCSHCRETYRAVKAWLGESGLSLADTEEA